MTDTQGTTGDDEAAEALIAELLEAGFAYESNGRLAGLAEPEGKDDAPEEPDPDAEDVGDPEGDSGAEQPDVLPVDDEPADQGRGAHSGRLELKGTPLTDLEADNLLHLRQLLIDNPELAEEMQGRLTGRRTIPSAPPQQQAPVGEAVPDEPKLPDFIDPDDQTSVRLWQEISELRGAAAQTHGALEEATQAASQAKVDADVASAVDRFKVDHPDLTDEEIQSIRNYSSANVNIQGVMSNFPLDPVTGLVKALEIGSMSDPAVRDKVLGIKRDDRAEQDKTRAGNLSKLTGSSGSASRRAPKPVKASNWNEAASMIAKELEALGGTQ